jgi:hypothetical protein
MAKIKVLCIQSHMTPTAGGHFREYEAWKEYAIDEEQFAPNLFARIEPAKRKKEKEDR